MSEQGLGMRMLVVAHVEAQAILRADEDPRAGLHAHGGPRERPDAIADLGVLDDTLVYYIIGDNGVDGGPADRPPVQQ
jgi:hypothetical protein